MTPAAAQVACGRFTCPTHKIPLQACTTGVKRYSRPWLVQRPFRAPCQTFSSTARWRDSVYNEGPLYRRITRQQSKDAQVPKDGDTESVKPESYEKLKERDPTRAPSTTQKRDDVKREQQITQTQANDPLLQETTVSNKEQRKADWAIIKEMSKYLWPKDSMGTRLRVGASVALLIGAKVCYNYCSSELCPGASRVAAMVTVDLLMGRAYAYIVLHVGTECASSLLFQKHCRYHERRFCCPRWHGDERSRRNDYRMYASCTFLFPCQSYLPSSYTSGLLRKGVDIDQNA